MNVVTSPNPLQDATTRFPAPSGAATAFHRRLPGYVPSPLFDLPALAERAGVARVLVKDESSRFGLPAFKMLGASWASYRAVVERLGHEPAWHDLDMLSAAVSALQPMALATATDGNHGRAVARMARWLGFGARIFVPAGTAAVRIEGIESEGASCTVVDGTYEDAVATAAKEAAEDCLVISDTAWPGYDTVPRWVIDGYATIFTELDEQLADADLPAPTAAIVPIGVGALAAAASHALKAEGRLPAALIGVEPDTADCMRVSVLAGEPVEVPGPHHSIMAGLNCGEVSPIAFPLVKATYSVLAAVDDEVAGLGMQALAAEGIVSGESGAAGTGLLLAATADDGPGLAALGLGPEDVVLLVSTEGATDPVGYEAIVGRPPAAVGRP